MFACAWSDFIPCTITVLTQESDGISLTDCEGQLQATANKDGIISAQFTQVMGIMVNNSYMSKFLNLTLGNVYDYKIQMTFIMTFCNTH